MRIPRYPRNTIVSVKRSGVLQACGITSAWSPYDVNPNIGMVSSIIDYTLGFSAYLINAFKVTFIPYFTGIDEAQVLANQTAGPVAAYVPRVYTIVERNSNAQYSTENSMLEEAKLRIVRDPMKTFSIYVKVTAVWLVLAQEHQLRMYELESCVNFMYAGCPEGRNHIVNQAMDRWLNF